MLLFPFLLIIFSNIASKPSIILQNGVSFGDYSPRLKIKASLEGHPGKKVINADWAKDLSIGLGALIILKEEVSLRGLYMSTGYRFFKKLPYEHYLNLDLGFLDAIKTFIYGVNYNINYYINDDFGFRYSMGIGRDKNTNLDLLFGVQLKF